MLHWALIFFVVAIIASVLGARGVAGISAQVGYALVVLAIIFVVLAFLFGRAPAVGAAMQPAFAQPAFAKVAVSAPITTAPNHVRY